MRQILSTATVAVLVSLLTLTVAGAMAQTGPAQEAIEPSAIAVRNADKVDGKHAVRATRTLRLRAKKLVATDKKGFLPDNIVQPLWQLIKNKPAVLADGQVAWNEIVGRPAPLITVTVPCSNPIKATGDNYVVFPNLPRQAVYDFQVVPHTTPGVILYIERVEVVVNPDSTLTMGVRIVDRFGFGTGSCNVRASAVIGEGISLASVRNSLNKANVRHAWKP